MSDLWSVQRARAYGLGAMPAMPDPVGAYFGAKSAKAEAKYAYQTAVDTAKIGKQQAIAEAKALERTARRKTSWTPVLVIGAVAVAGIVAFAVVRRRRGGAA